MVGKVENRGTVIQQGGSKALLNLARDSTPKGTVVPSVPCSMRQCA